MFQKFCPDLYISSTYEIDFDRLYRDGYRGLIFDIDNIKNRNTKQLVKKIKRFKDWIFDNELYDVEYHHVGDDICVIRKRVAQ